MLVDKSGCVTNKNGRILKKYLDRYGYAYVKINHKRKFVIDLVMEQLYSLDKGLVLRHIDFKARACDIYGAHEVVTGDCTRPVPTLEPMISPTASGKFAVYFGADYLGTYLDYEFAVMVGNDPSLAVKRSYEDKLYKPRERKEYRPRGRKMKRRKHGI